MSFVIYLPTMTVEFVERYSDGELVAYDCNDNIVCLDYGFCSTDTSYRPLIHGNFAFVPKSVMPSIHKNMELDYSHRVWFCQGKDLYTAAVAWNVRASLRLLAMETKLPRDLVMVVRSFLWW